MNSFFFFVSGLWQMKKFQAVCMRVAKRAKPGTHSQGPFPIALQPVGANSSCSSHRLSSNFFSWKNWEIKWNHRGHTWTKNIWDSYCRLTGAGLQMMNVPTCSRRCAQTSQCLLTDVDRDLMGKFGSFGLCLVSSLFYIMSLLNLSQFFVDTFLKCCQHLQRD